MFLLTSWCCSLATRPGFRESASFKNKFLILELVSCGFGFFFWAFLQVRSVIKLPDLNLTTLDLDLCFATTWVIKIITLMYTTRNLLYVAAAERSDRYRHWHCISCLQQVVLVQTSCWILCDQCSRQAILLWWVLIDIIFALTDLEMGTVLLGLCKLLLLQQSQEWVPYRELHLSKWWNLAASWICGNYQPGNFAISMLQKPTFL